MRTHVLTNGEWVCYDDGTTQQPLEPEHRAALPFTLPTELGDEA